MHFAQRSPYISVLMAVHNGAAYLANAVESILQQTFTNFEFIIIDDGSTDESPQILMAYAQQDKRLRVVNQANQGLTKSLNAAWALAQGVFIARMDADDVSLPERFARQIAFLEANPHIAACGSWVQTIDENGNLQAVWRYPTSSEEIQFELLFRNVLAHPSVMLRRDAFDAAGLRYDPRFRRAQDYELWLRASDRLALANLPEVLLHYRMSAQQISHQHQPAQLSASVQIYTQRLQQMGLAPTRAELALHEQLFLGNSTCEPDILREMGKWLTKIAAANQQTDIYPPADFQLFLAKKWLHLCRKCAGMGLSAWTVFLSSPLSHLIPTQQQLKFGLRCLLRKKD